jgi:hypothetical protein
MKSSSFDSRRSSNLHTFYRRFNLHRDEEESKNVDLRKKKNKRKQTWGGGGKL